MNANKALWEKGDFTRIAESMRDSGEALVDGLGITRGLDVLDVGCGDGTTALPAARRGANVLGVDIAAYLVEAGNERARAEGLTNCTFQEGDASDLNELGNASFDLVVSIFGAMFAPRPFDVAREMVRVTPTGRTDRHGQLDPQRSDTRRAAPQGQRRLLPTAAGGIRQPGHVGRRGQRFRAVRRRRDPARAGLLLPRDIQVRLWGPPCHVPARRGRRLSRCVARDGAARSERRQQEARQTCTPQRRKSPS
jgi:SAM-dependent methyltransferase